MDIYLYKLRFKSAVHFGDTGIDLENVQESAGSDAFFSALINAVKIYYGTKEAGYLIKKFLENPPFILTSLFIYSKDSYFLPKPLDDSFIPEDVKKAKGKDLKKLKWLEKSDFFRWQRQDSFTVEDIEAMQKRQSKYKDAFVKEIRPRVRANAL